MIFGTTFLRGGLRFALLTLALTSPVVGAETMSFGGVLSERALGKEINSAQRQSWAYLQQASRLDRRGTSLAALPSSRERHHSCRLLGRLLGMEGAIGPFAPPATPEVVAPGKSQAIRLRAAAAELAQYAAAGSRIARMKTPERALEWNLDCADRAVGHHTTAAAPTEAFFRLDDNGRVLRVLGDITPGFAARFRAALATSPRVRVVALGSPGGTVDEAIEVGRMIRRRGLQTVLWNDCYSACPLIFAGGVQRRVHAPSKALGVHEMSGENSAAPRTFAEYREIQRYLRDMDVDAEAMIKLMWRAPPAGMHEIDLAGDEACKIGLATWVEGVCDARARRR